VCVVWCGVCVCVFISDCVQTLYELPSLPNDTTVKHFYTNIEHAKCWLDIYRWGAGLSVTGPIRDIGQNVLLSSFQTESSSSPVTATFSSSCHSSKRPLLKILFLLTMELQSPPPQLGQGLPLIEDSLSHTDTPYSVEPLWTNDQPDAETSTWQHTSITKDRHPCPRRDSNTRSQKASGRRPTPETARSL